VTGVLGEPGRMEISDWHQGIEWHLIVNNKYQPYRYLENPRFLLDYIQKSNNRNKSAWINAIPAEIFATINQFKTLQFSLLYHVSRYSDAYELFVSHPNLLWFLLSHAKAKGWTEAKVVQCLKMKRTRILKACGFPDTPSAVKMLKKLLFEQYGAREFKLIKQLLCLSEYAKINHIEKLDVRLAILICENPGLLGSRYVQYYTPQDWGGMLDLYLQEIRMMAAQLLNMTDIIERIGRCAGLNQIYRLYGRLVDKMNRTPLEAFVNVDYQEPPLPGTETIIPINTSHELALEGKEQQHCIRSYHQHIVDGVYYVYRVIHPERATLGILNLGDGTLVIDGLTLKRNQEVSDDTVQHVHNWLNEKAET
jgi:hypothetical protein